MIRNFIYIVVLIIVFGCSIEKRNELMYLYSSDKTQVVTILTDYTNNKRFIVNGKHKYIPKDNYYLIDISQISELGDEIGVCWSIGGKEWQIVNDKARIIEIKIDTSSYSFKDRWYKNERGIPNAKYYRQDNCFTVGVLNYSENFPRENGSVERVSR
jgi:hypothetical protein